MMTIYYRDRPLGFGKYSGLSPVEIATYHPSYFEWLHREKVIRFQQMKDQNWFNRRAGRIRRQLQEAACMADMIRLENGFDGDDDEAELERERGATRFLTG